METEKKGFWAQPGNRLVVWTLVIAALLSISKVFLPEPYPQLYSKAATAYNDKDYNAIIEWSLKAEESYPDRYKANNLGYFRSFALNKLGQFEQSQKYLEEYISFAPKNLNAETQRLMADNLLSLNRTEEAIQVLVTMYREHPYDRQDLIDEILRVRPNYDLASQLDPAKDQLAYSILQARQKNQSKRSERSGILHLPVKAGVLPMYLRESIFFELTSLNTSPDPKGTRLQGTIRSWLSLKKVGFRVTAFDPGDLYLDETVCEIENITQGKDHPFNCLLPDKNKLGSLHLQEIRVEL